MKLRSRSSKILTLGASTLLLGVFIGACGGRLAPTGSTPVAPAAAQIRNADDLKALGATYAQIAKSVTPAVVNINSTQIVRGRVLRDPFAEFFGDDFGGMRREPDRRAQSLGSGVLVDKSGIILTNHHVIANASEITVTLSDRRHFKARLIGSDPASDVAVLKIQANNLPALKWSDSDKLQVGDIVLAIGSPFNLASTVTQGIISAKGRRDLGISAYEDFLQTDAAINPGNSGGALVDMDGNLVGINTAILSESGGNQGIGLAIPSNLAHKLSGQLIKDGKVTRGWLGLVVVPVTGDIAAAMRLPDIRGVLVTGVYTRGPSGQADWSENGGDIITKFNGTPVESPGQLRNLIADAAPGSKVTLEVWQNGRTRTLTIQSGARPARVQGV
jgi:Do/DeqQ family serine protease